MRRYCSAVPEQHPSTPSARSSRRHGHFTPAQRRGTGLALLLFFACWAMALLAVIFGKPGLNWAEGGLLITGAAATLVVLSRRLPAQNVLAIATLIGLGTALITFVSDRTGIPFGSRACTERFGVIGFSVLPWPAPLLWICVLLNSRAVARLILRPWRRTEHYGVWLIALAAALAVAIDLSLEPHAAQARHYWIWQATAAAAHWHTAPMVNFFGWFMTTVVFLVVAAPWLINKHPVKQAPDYLPLVLWLALNLYLVAANAVHGFASAVVAGVVLSVAVGASAIRGATW